jgi:radical SAM superfamily enzyme YgiQ (UPF0313 family)
MRLLLAYPGNPSIGDKDRAGTRRMAAIGLPVIANVTPPDWEVEIIDEEQGEKIDYSRHYDLVGITSMTSQAPRAYAIADEFRRHGVPVVHGGSHATVCPEEALEHGDAVVRGEGERAWPALLQDLATKGHVPHRVYELRPGPDELWYVPPKRSLVNLKNAYPVTPVVATRGCPFTCAFCSVFSVFGRGYRHRPVEDVIEEVRALRDAGHRNIVFLDDNIMGAPKWSKRLFRALAALDIRWAGQAHLAAARDPELMRLAKASGLFALFIGIESVSRASLAGVRKGINDIDSYKTWVKTFHDHGVFIFAGMIFGFDQDDPTVFSRTVEVLDKLDIAVGNFSLLVPLPGTDVHTKLKAEGRLIDTDWAHYDGSHVVYRPAKMTPEQLAEGSDWAAYEYFTPARMLRRFGSNWRNPLFYWIMSLAYMYKERAQHGAGSALPLSRSERAEVLATYGLA